MGGGWLSDLLRRGVDNEDDDGDAQSKKMMTLVYTCDRCAGTWVSSEVRSCSFHRARMRRRQSLWWAVPL